MSEAMRPQAAAPSSWPANNAFLRFRAIGLMRFSTQLVSISSVRQPFLSGIVFPPAQAVFVVVAVTRPRTPNTVSYGACLAIRSGAGMCSSVACSN